MLGMRLILSKVFDKFHLLFYKPLWFFKNFLILKILKINQKIKHKINNAKDK